jgi:hypothetical protein
LAGEKVFELGNQSVALKDEMMVELLAVVKDHELGNCLA